MTLQRAALLIAGGMLGASMTFAAEQTVPQVPAAFAPLPRAVPAPADNPTTPEKVALGKLLFWDPILSGPQDIACATCHHPDFGYTDGRDLPIGTGGEGIGPKRVFRGQHPLVKRNSPTIRNVGFTGFVDPAGPFDPSQAPMFWDSRVRGLEAQALAPIESLEEMRGDQIPDGGGVAAAVARVAAVREYRELFQRVFGEPDAVTAVNMSRAIAAFERTLITAETPFDRYLRGDLKAITPAAIYGMRVFDEQGCTGCHKGPMLSDYQLHVLGAPDHPGAGRDTGAEGRFAFRTPPLRNLAVTAPYFHSGRFEHLSTAIGVYRRLPAPGAPVGRERLDVLAQQINLESGLGDVTEFLATLNGPFDRTIPRRVPSGLKPGGK